MSKLLELETKLVGVVLKDALTHKNEFIARILALEERLKYNSYEVGFDVPYEVSKVMDELKETKRVFVILKSKINWANGPIWHLIIERNELKDLIKQYGELDTRSGKQDKSSPYGGEMRETQFIASISRLEADKEMEKIGERMIELQHQLDIFNLKTQLS